VVSPPVSNTPSDLSQYNLTNSELGLAPDLRPTKQQTTPLEDLLAAMFPEAAANYALDQTDPFANPRPTGGKPSLLNTILGNLQTSSPAQVAQTQNYGIPAAVSSVPGAPAFLSGAVNNLQSGFVAPTVPGAGANPLNSLAGVSAIAAEQRIQQAEQAKAKADAQATWFKSQQKLQKAAKQREIQRQGFGFSPSGVSTIGGWTSPKFY
jgi:hypothetical protein